MVTVGLFFHDGLDIYQKSRPRKLETAFHFQIQSRSKVALVYPMILVKTHTEIFQVFAHLLGCLCNLGQF